MLKVLKRLHEELRSSNGASLVEYGLLVGLIAAVAVGAVSAFGILVTNALFVIINNAI